MTTRTQLAFLSALLVALFLSPSALCDEPAAALVQKAWAVTDAVLDNQVDSLSAPGDAARRRPRLYRAAARLRPPISDAASRPSRRRNSSAALVRPAPQGQGGR
jgi:hypothetical protein